MPAGQNAALTPTIASAIPVQRNAPAGFVHSSHGHVLLCTTFDGYKFNAPAFTQDSVQQINRDFQDGAIAVKSGRPSAWKIKDSNGKYVLPDDPKLKPIYEDIAQHDKTLLTHLAEPDLAWEPLDVKKDPLAQYYLENPQWHMLNKAGCALEEGDPGSP